MAVCFLDGKLLSFPVNALFAVVSQYIIRMINFFNAVSEERIRMDCRKMERQRMVIEMGSGTCLQYFRIFYRQDDPG